MAVRMYKNKQLLINNWGYNNHGAFEYLSNAIILELEQGDRVHMRLPANKRLYDHNSGNYNTFTGVLIYSM